MKFSTLVLAAVATAEDGDRKVSPRDPLQRLDKLVEYSHELLDVWYAWLPSQQNWMGKFERNAERMERNFKKCGPSLRRKRETDADAIWERYDREDPAIGTKQITFGFRKWAERYLAGCSGQRKYNHQVNRMNKWNGLLQDHLAANQD